MDNPDRAKPRVPSPLRLRTEKPLTATSQSDRQRVDAPLTGTPRAEAGTSVRSTLFDRAWMALFVVDRTGSVLDANPAAHRLLERPAGALPGTSIHRYLPRDTYATLWHRLLAGTHVYFHTTAPLSLPGNRTPAVRVIAWLVSPGRAADEAVCCLLPLSPPGSAPSAHVPAACPSLSAAEALIVEGLALGLSNAELSRELHLSRQGLDYHIGRLRQKLRARSRTALVARAYTVGLLTVGVWPPRVPAGAQQTLATSQSREAMQR